MRDPIIISWVTTLNNSRTQVKEKDKENNKSHIFHTAKTILVRYTKKYKILLKLKFLILNNNTWNIL